MVIIALLAIVLFAAAVGYGFSALREPQLRRSENLDQIGAYGYAGGAEPIAPNKQAARMRLDSFASSIGDAAVKRFARLREDDMQRALVSAGFYGIGARRFLGYRVLLTI